MQKSKLALWFVSHCSTSSKREIYVNNLKKFLNITIYGTCNKMPCDKSCENQAIGNICILSFKKSFIVEGCDVLMRKLLNHSQTKFFML
jgi:hypothetical protein